MLTKRIIPCLDIKDGRTVKGVNFVNLRDAGDPVELAKRYTMEGADELVFLDISATEQKRKTLSDLVLRVAGALNIPFTVGGGVSSVSDAKNLLLSGADKIALNTAGLSNPKLIKDLVENFGSQCVVISIQARKKYDGSGWEAMSEMGREKSGKDVLDWINEVQGLGAGEILLTSVDKDGTLSTPDYDLINRASKVSKIPLVVSGGITKTIDIESVLNNPSFGMTISFE